MGFPSACQDPLRTGRLFAADPVAVPVEVGCVSGGAWVYGRSSCCSGRRAVLVVDGGRCRSRGYSRLLRGLLCCRRLSGAVCGRLGSRSLICCGLFRCLMSGGLFGGELVSRCFCGCLFRSKLICRCLGGSLLSCSLVGCNLRRCGFGLRLVRFHYFAGLCFGQPHELPVRSLSADEGFAVVRLGLVAGFVSVGAAVGVAVACCSVMRPALLASLFGAAPAATTPPSMNTRIPEMVTASALLRCGRPTQERCLKSNA
jgi:hypothetical protein